MYKSTTKEFHALTKPTMVKKPNKTKQNPPKSEYLEQGASFYRGPCSPQVLDLTFLFLIKGNNLY